MGEEAEAEEDGEERHRRLRDRRDAGVDVLLAPGDEPERQRRCDDAEHHPAAPRGAQLRDGAPGAHRPGEEARTARAPRLQRRAPISGDGSRPPSTATLMKRYDAPQTAARTRISVQYRFTWPRYPRPEPPAGRERRAAEDQREARERGRRDGLVEDQRAVDERERRHEVRHEDRARRAGAHDQREIEEIGDARPEHSQHEDCPDDLRRGRLGGPLQEGDGSARSAPTLSCPIDTSSGEKERIARPA